MESSLSDNLTMTITMLACLSLWATSYYYSRGFPLSLQSTVIEQYVGLCGYLNDKLVLYITGSILILTVGFYVQYLNEEWMLTGERTRVPFLIYMLLTSANISLHCFSEATVVLLLTVLVMRDVFRAYQTPSATGKLFNAGVFIGASMLLAPKMLWYMPVLWLGMYQLRSLRVKSFFASLTGIMMVMVLTLSWCVFINDYGIFKKIAASLSAISIYEYTFDKLGFIVFIALFIIPSFVHVRRDAYNNSVRVRQLRSFLVNMSCWCLLMMCIYSSNADFYIGILSIPASLLSGCLIEHMRLRLRFTTYYLLLAYCVTYYLTTSWNI